MTSNIEIFFLKGNNTVQYICFHRHHCAVTHLTWLNSRLMSLQRYLQTIRRSLRTPQWTYKCLYLFILTITFTHITWANLITDNYNAVLSTMTDGCWCRSGWLHRRINEHLHPLVAFVTCLLYDIVTNGMLRSVSLWRWCAPRSI